jgi:hypothetical protein
MDFFIVTQIGIFSSYFEFKKINMDNSSLIIQPRATHLLL